MILPGDVIYFASSSREPALVIEVIKAKRRCNYGGYNYDYRVTAMLFKTGQIKTKDFSYCWHLIHVNFSGGLGEEL